MIAKLLIFTNCRLLYAFLSLIFILFAYTKLPSAAEKEIGQKLSRMVLLLSSDIDKKKTITYMRDCFMKIEVILLFTVYPILLRLQYL